MDNNSIRAKIAAQGWKLLEIPIKKNIPELKVVRWKVIATRGDRSIEVGGETIDDALNIIGTTLGVIAKD